MATVDQEPITQRVFRPAADGEMSLSRAGLNTRQIQGHGNNVETQKAIVLVSEVVVV